MKIKSSIVMCQRLNQCVFKGGTYHSSKSYLITLKQNFSNWHLVGALCLERKPIITQSRTPLQQKYFNYLNKLEIEKSFLSEHEKRHLDDLKMAEKMKKGDVEDMDTVLKQTAQDFEDASLEEFNKFKPNPRTTEADLNNDQCSIQRKLESSLLLVIKQKIGNDYRWMLPQAIHHKGETLRETAERSFNDLCQSSVKLQVMGNAPVGYYKYKYPKLVRDDGTCGAKVFFFKAQLVDKSLEKLDLRQSDSVIEHVWLTQSELESFLQPVYAKVVQSFLYPVSLNVDDSSIKNCLYEEDEPIIKTSASN